jgi:putative addiction module killer protein
MPTIRPLPEFTAWMEALKDAKVRATLAARIRRLGAGLPGDVVSVGEGVSELRIHLGAGWRVYFTLRGAEIVVLLVGVRRPRRPPTSSAPRPWLRSCKEWSRHDRPHRRRFTA